MGDRERDREGEGGGNNRKREIARESVCAFVSVFVSVYVRCRQSASSLFLVIASHFWRYKASSYWPFVVVSSRRRR